MKVIAYGISVIIILSGAVFALQGLSFLPSRVMYGRQEWVVIGGVMVLAGLALMLLMRFGAVWSMGEAVAADVVARAVLFVTRL